MENDTVELTTRYKYRNWHLESNIGQDTISGLNEYSNYISVKPIYNFNDNYYYIQISKNIDDEKTSIREYKPFFGLEI